MHSALLDRERCVYCTTILLPHSNNNITVLEDLIINIGNTPSLSSDTQDSKNGAAGGIVCKASPPAVPFVVCALYCQSTIPRLLL